MKSKNKLTRSTNGRLRVCHIVTTFPRFEEDPQVPWLVEALRRLKRSGIEVTVFAPSYRGLGNHDVFGIPVKRFRYAPAFMETLTHDEGAPNKLNRPFSKILVLFYLLGGLWGTLRLSRQARFDVIHVHWPFPQGIFGYLASKFHRSKLVLHFYTAELVLGSKYWWGRWLLRFLIRQADHVVALSSFTRDSIYALQPVPIVILPYGSAIKPRVNPVSRDEIPRVLFVGRLVKRKGVEYLIQAVKLLVEKGRKIQLEIVGEGDQKEILQQMVRDKGLESIVTLHGHVSVTDLSKQYQQCDFFVLPAIIDSRGDTEGQGVVLLEAMGHKKPVIATRVGGIVDIVQDGDTGILVPPQNSQAIADAIEHLLDHPDDAQRFGEKGCDWGSKQFGWDQIMDRWIELYQSSL